MRTSWSLFNLICWHKFITPLSYCPIVSLFDTFSTTSSTLPHILYSLLLLCFLILTLPSIPPNTPTPTPAHFFPFSSLLLLLLFPPSLSSSSHYLIQLPLLLSSMPLSLTDTVPGRSRPLPTHLAGDSGSQLLHVFKCF